MTLGTTLSAQDIGGLILWMAAWRRAPKANTLTGMVTPLGIFSYPRGEEALMAGLLAVSEGPK